MQVFNGSHFRSSAPTTYGFEPGHVFAIQDVDEVLYKHIGHDRHVLTASPLANPNLRQVFTQDAFGELVDAGKVDPRMEQNSEARQTLLARVPDIKSARDLPDEEREELGFLWLVCRQIVQMYNDGLTSLTDKALTNAIAKVMAKLVYGVEEEAVVDRRGRTGKGKVPASPRDHKINARKSSIKRNAPRPSTVRKWIRDLIENDWDLLALRDHRKGRVGYRAPKITDPQSVSLMAKWVQAYLDRSRPTAAILYKLMIGSVTLEEENARRDREGHMQLRATDAPSFAAQNLARSAEGLPPLPAPSKSTFERAIRKLDKYQVAVGRYGTAYARKKFKVGGRGKLPLYPGERISIDSWRVQLMALKLPQEFWAGLPDDLVGKLGKLRLSVCVAIDEATKVVPAVRLSVNADADTAIRTLEMVCRNKTEIAMAAGCRSTWHHTCTPLMVSTDSGSEFIDAGFRCAVRDIGSANEIGPASHPDARGVMERFFRTMDSQLLSVFQGRTFGGISEKGDYNSAEVANVLVELLARALIRYIVDVYHNSPHEGLGGQTPNDAWEERAALYKVLPPPPPHVVRTVFGFSDNRRIQNRGIRFLGLYYRSAKLAQLRKIVGQADVRIRANLEDLGTLWVSLNVPGAEWIAVPCEIDMEGVSSALWLEVAAALRRKHADAAKLREHVVLAALRDLRESGRHSASAKGIGPSTVTKEQLLKHESDLVRHFDYTVASERGHAFDGLEIDVEQPDDSDFQDSFESSDVAQDEAADDAFDTNDEPQPARRRGRRFGSDFLRKD